MNQVNNNLFNILVHNIGCNISSNCSSIDGKDINNLLNNNGEFIPCGFHSPPIYITITLPVSYLSIVCIKLGTIVNSHSTNKISFYFSNKDNIIPNYIPKYKDKIYNYGGTYNNLESYPNWCFYFSHSNRINQEDLNKIQENSKIINIQRPMSFSNKKTSIILKLIQGNKSRICPLKFLQVWCTFSLSATKQQQDEFIRLYSNRNKINTNIICIPKTINNSVFQRIYNPEKIDFESYNNIPLSVSEIENYLNNMNISIPNEYIDSITNSIMLNPYITPTGIRLDKKTILQHLQESSTDPFTGLTMKIEDTFPDEKLKQVIHSFIKQHYNSTNNKQTNIKKRKIIDIIEIDKESSSPPLKKPKLIILD